MMIQELTLEGGRQTGKSYAAMKLAIDAAKRGERVLYDCDSSRMAIERFRNLQEMVPASDVARVFRANGQERIEFRTGGRILVINARAGGGRGITADVHVIDHDDGRGEANPTAQRVVRTKLAPAS
jgi:hypothetical protein